MKKAIAIVCICVFSVCLFANQNFKAQPAGTANQGASEYLLTIADKKVPWETERVGEKGPAGGYIFYDKGSNSDGWRYLEAAPAGWSGSRQDPPYAFGYYRPSGPNKEVGTSTAIGSGKANTAALVKAMGNQAYTSSSGNSKAAYAAKVASDYRITVNGVTYNDWFLPSSDELNLMYTNLHKKNLGGFSDAYYWSSSEYFYYGAWNQDFTYGLRENGGRVRPVRAF